MENYGDVFTANNWKGGHFELLLCPLVDSVEEQCAVLNALWTFPSLDGCYLEKNRSPSSQARVQPSENCMSHRLYGMLTVPNGKVVPCGCYATETSKGVRWVILYLPQAALSNAYPKIGAYPFGPMDAVSEWKPVLESFLAEIGRWTSKKVPISLALVGFEVVSDISPDIIRANGIPGERSEGILWNEDGDLKWYPATRP